MRAHARSGRGACARHAIHRCVVSGVTSAGDVYDVGERIELDGLVVELASVDVEERSHQRTFESMSFVCTTRRGRAPRSAGSPWTARIFTLICGIGMGTSFASSTSSI